MFESTNQDIITIIKIRYDVKIMTIYEGTYIYIYIMSENGEARQMAVSVFNAKMMIKPWLLGAFAPKSSHKLRGFNSNSMGSKHLGKGLHWIQLWPELYQ